MNDSLCCGSDWFWFYVTQLRSATVGINVASTLVVSFTAIWLTFASIAACGESVGAGVPGVATVGLVALAGTVGFVDAPAGVGTCGLTALPADVFMATK